MNNEKVRLRATWTLEYWADPASYGECSTSEEMAALDAAIEWPSDILDNADSVFTVEVVEGSE